MGKFCRVATSLVARAATRPESSPESYEEMPRGTGPFDSRASRLDSEIMVHDS